jgi:hypothetical protein
MINEIEVAGGVKIGKGKRKKSEKEIHSNKAFFPP